MLKITIKQTNLYWIRKYYFKFSRAKVAKLTNLSTYMIKRAEVSANAKPYTIKKLAKFYYSLFTKCKNINPKFKAWGELEYAEQ